ncbi:MAG: outer membrane lipoprotein carrier protein LolA [Spirochaetota bacterium]
MAPFFRFQKQIFLSIYFFLSVCSFISSQSSGRLQKVIAKMNSLKSVRAKININGTLTGTLSYKRPYNLHIKFSDGRIISANKNFLWVYSPGRMIAGKQDLRGGTGGIGGLLSGYESVTEAGNTIKLRSTTRTYEEIIVVVTPDNYLRSLRMKRQGSSTYSTINLSIIGKNIGLPSNLFNFHPPSSAQIVENPLNQKE